MPKHQGSARLSISIISRTKTSLVPVLSRQFLKSQSRYRVSKICTSLVSTYFLYQILHFTLAKICICVAKWLSKKLFGPILIAFQHLSTSLENSVSVSVLGGPLRDPSLPWIRVHLKTRTKVLCKSKERAYMMITYTWGGESLQDLTTYLTTGLQLPLGTSGQLLNHIVESKSPENSQNAKKFTFNQK